MHGGAARGATAEPSLAARQAANAPGKAAIGRKAASFIEDGMVVILDSGSTTLRARLCARGAQKPHRPHQQPADRASLVSLIGCEGDHARW